MRAQDVALAPARMALLPANVRIFELTFEGENARDDWTTAARQNVDAVVTGIARANGASVLDPKQVAETAVPYEALVAWSERALLEIAARLEGVGHDDRRSVSEWKFEYDLTSWQAPLNADFVVVVLFRDAHESAGRIVGNMFSMVQVHARQTGIACAVRLSDSRIVWCERYVDPHGDLRELSSAHMAVDRLLRGILPNRKIRLRRPPPVPPAAPPPAPPARPEDSTFGA